MLDLLALRLYWHSRDWCGLGYGHRMVAWTWRGTPRSLRF